MALEVPELKTGLLGYDKRAVEDLLSEREDLYVRAARENAELKARIDEQIKELTFLRAEVTRHQDAAWEAERRSSESEELFRAADVRVAELVAALDAERAAAKTEIAAQTQVTRRAEEEAERADRAAEEAERRARKAEGEIARLTARIDRLRTELEVVNDELGRARAEAEEARAGSRRPMGPEDVVPMAPGDVAAALEAAEQAMDRMVDEGRRRVAEELEDLRRRRDDARSELAETVRAALDPLLRSVTSLQERLVELEAPGDPEHGSGTVVVDEAGPEDEEVDTLVRWGADPGRDPT